MAPTSAPPTISGTPLLEMRNIRKDFSGVVVLKGVDLTLQPGEIHALVGENGAGKSTLIKILGGVHTDFAGSVRIAGHSVRPRNPRAAEALGVAVIHQELALIPYLTVADNLHLGREPINRVGWIKRQDERRAAADVLRTRLGVDLDVTRRLHELPIAAQQLVEIAKALSRDARVLVMDEPTSALSEADTEHLFRTIQQLRDAGVGIIYISHRLDEIYSIADRITVLRDGQHVGTATPAELPRDRLVQWMVGRSVAVEVPQRSAERGVVRLDVRDLSVRVDDRWLVRDAHVQVHAGEIVGLAGLMGSGNSELLAAIYGRLPLHAGRITLDGLPVSSPTPRESLRNGVALLTNDRKASGLVLPMSVLHNMSLATLRRFRRLGGLLSHARERAAVAPYAERMNLRGPSLSAEVATLSGGNQQKAIIARWLLTEPRVFLLDEPTRGIDVAAKADIYALLTELTAAGMGILLITSELPELLALSDRIIVMHRGRMQCELAGAEATQERILHAAMGGE